MQVNRKNELTPNDSLYPLGEEPELVLVTPEMASDWLTARRSPKQRNISVNIVAKYLRDMQAGRWKVTRQGLIFDTEGYNIDGQHRMRALANCDRDTLELHYGQPGVLFWLYPNELAESFDAYDQNYKRTAAHLMKEPYATNIAATARLLAAASDQDPWSFPRLSRIATSEVLEVKAAWPEIARHIAKVTTLHRPTRIAVPEHAAVLAQASRTEHADKIPAWLESIHHGTGMDADDPRLRLRDRFMSSWVAMSGAGQRPLRYSLIAKAWNAHAQDAKISILRWEVREQIPAVAGFDWSQAISEESE
jgi:hypothetical protein